MPSDLRVRLAAVTVLSAIALLVGSVQVVAAGRTVTMVDDRFKPPAITVTVGTTVHWVNRGDSAHTVTSRVNGQFDSSLVQPGDGFSHTFSRTGTYRYFCFLHDGMNGVVTVRAAARPTPRPTRRPTTRPRPTARGGGGGNPGGAAGGGGRPTQPPSDTLVGPGSQPDQGPEPLLLLLLGSVTVGGFAIGPRRLARVRAADR